MEFKIGGLPPARSWSYASSPALAISGSGVSMHSLFVEGTESLMLSPMMVKPSIAMESGSFRLVGVSLRASVHELRKEPLTEARRTQSRLTCLLFHLRVLR